jgi:UDP-N-acetylglucosamine 1-carboxyvinyltransferase
METKSVKIFPGELNGDIYIYGAKNAVLKYLAASILTDESVRIDNYPKNMLDVCLHEEMLEHLGKHITKFEDSVMVEGAVTTSELLWEKRSIRNTLLILGALLTKTGYGKVPLPGGCKLGDRKYDIHIGLMEAMGAKVWEEDNYLCAKSESRMHGCEYYLPIRSTGATENALIMGSLAEGITKIWNPHIRPEILDLVFFLTKLGAKIKVNGQESIVINGVKKLNNATRHKSKGDNMQALTYLMMGGIAGKELYIHNFPFEDLEVPLMFLRFSGLKYFKNEQDLIVRKCGQYPLDISTGPYPGINSDMQPIMAVWASLAKGISTITDLRFVGRYGYANEMRKMGVVTEVQDNKLIIHGGNNIVGSEVTAIDLRAGAALLLLSLIADSPTLIKDFWMIERGYDDIINVLKSIGVNLISE